jgi:hypothetical protein
MVLFVALAAASLADAHPDPRAPAVRIEAAPSSPGPGVAPPGAGLWLAGPALVGALIARHWGRRRALALGTALVVTVFAAEGAVHSVHHLKDSRDGERCPVFWMSQHVTGLSAGPATPEPPPPSPVSDRLLVVSRSCPSCALDREQPRAPPAPPA